ncbi:MAG TPA: hypothetical protein V6C97_27520 [Oculatellaceae cyanobacterium]
MPTFNYGSRNGVSTVISAVKMLCHIYTAYQARIIEWVNGSSLSAAQKTALIDWLNLATASCAILVSVQVDYER